MEWLAELPKNFSTTTIKELMNFKNKYSIPLYKLASILEITPQTISLWIKKEKIPTKYQKRIFEIKNEIINKGYYQNENLNSMIYDIPILARWHWQGFLIKDIAKASELRKNIVANLLEKFNIREKSNTKQMGRPKQTKEGYLKNLQSRFGKTIYLLLVNYPNDPLTTQSDIARMANVSREYIRQTLYKIHGTNIQKIKIASKKVCFSNKLKEPFNTKFKEEGIKYIELPNRIFKVENGKTFIVRKMSLHKASGLYIINNPNFESDYIIANKDNEVYIIPSFQNYDTSRIYYHYPQDLEGFDDFSCLKKEYKEDKQEHIKCVTNQIDFKESPIKQISRKLSNDDIREMIELYEFGINTPKISNLYNVSISTVRYHLKKNNIEIRKGKDRKFSIPLHEIVCSICGEKMFRKKGVYINCPPEICRHCKGLLNKTETKNCRYCGKEFQITKRSGEEIFCSIECSVAQLHKDEQELSKRFAKIKHEVHTNNISFSDISEIVGVQVSTVKRIWSSCISSNNINKDKIEKLENFLKINRL